MLIYRSCLKLKDLVQEALDSEQLLLLDLCKKIQISWNQCCHKIEYISVGTPLVCITFDTETIWVNAPASGWYFLAFSTEPDTFYHPGTFEQKYDDGWFMTRCFDTIHFCCENAEELLSHCYHLIYKIENDLFTKEQTIHWDSYIQDLPNLTINPVYKYGQEESNYKNSNRITFTLLLQKNNTIALVEYGGGKFYPEITPRTIKHFYFLFENNDVIKFSPNHKLGTFNGSRLGKWVWELDAKTIRTFSTCAIKSIRIESNTESYIEDIHTINKLCLKEYFCQYIKALTECGIKLTNIPQETSEDSKKDSKCCYVYLMKDNANGYHKIGISNNPQYRERTLQSEKPNISLIAAKEFPIRPIAEAFEFALHKTYESKRLRGEWFDLSPEDVEVLKRTLS